MGFGSYDESEQERQDVDADDLDDDEAVKTEDAEHSGEVNYEGLDDTDSLLDRLNDMKEN